MAKSRAPTNWVFSIAFSLSIFSRIARRCRMASRLFIVVSLLMESAVIGLTDTGLLSEQFPLNILCPSTDCLRRPLVVHSASAGARVTIWTGTLEGKRTSFVLVLPGIATPAATVCMLAVTAWRRRLRDGLPAHHQFDFEATQDITNVVARGGCEVGQIFRHGVRGLDLPHAAKKRDQLTVYASSRELENTAAGQKASLQQNRVVRCKSKHRVWRRCSGVQSRKECWLRCRSHRVGLVHEHQVELCAQRNIPAAPGSLFDALQVTFSPR